MEDKKLYRKKNLQEMRPYVPGEDMTGISVNKEDVLEEGGMIAVNANNPEDRWYVGKKFFEDNYELAQMTMVTDQTTKTVTEETPLEVIDDTHAVTTVFASEYRTVGGAHSKYTIKNKEGIVLGKLSFQDGAIKQVGSNGVMNEDLLAIVIDRLRGFQAGEFACEQNNLALLKLQAALTMLKDRTKDRTNRGVQGEYQK